MSMTGCAGLQTPIGTYNFSSAESAPKEAPKEAPKKDERTFKEKSGVSPPVAVLLGLGAILMMTSIAAMNIDEGDGEEFMAITGGTGLLLWGSAGIVYLAEGE